MSNNGDGSDFSPWRRNIPSQKIRNGMLNVKTYTHTRACKNSLPKYTNTHTHTQNTSKMKLGGDGVATVRAWMHAINR